MKLSNVAGLYGDRLRAQLGQELLALVGIAVGVSLLFAALVANASLTGSFERVTRGVVGDARYQLAGRGAGLSEEKLGEVQGLAGVDTAAAILEVRAEIRGPAERRSVLLIGVTPEFAELGGDLTRGFSYRWLADVRAMALPSPLVGALGARLGQSVPMNIAGLQVQARLGAKLQRSDIGSLVESPVAIAPLRYAQDLSRQPGAISRIFVRPRPGHEAEVQSGLTRLAAGRADVRAADFDSVLFRQASQPTSQSTAMFSIFSAMVGFLFAFSAVLLTVPQRHLLIADLRTEGYGTSTVLKVLLFDALVLGVVASAVGLVLGDQLARHLFEQKASFLDMAFAFGSERITTLSTVAIAAAGGILASCVAVLAPMRSAITSADDEAGTSPTAGASRAGTLPAVAGFAFLMAGIVIVAEHPDSASVGIAGLACLTGAMLGLLPSLLRLLVAGIDAATRSVRSIVVFLAISDLRDPATRLRSLAVAATGAVAVFGSVALQGAHADLQRGLDHTAHDLASLGDLWAVAPGSANLLVTTPFQAPQVTPPREIAKITAYRGSFLDIGNRRIWVFGTPVDSERPIPRGQILDGSSQRATRLLRSGGWAIVSAALAHQRGLHVGDQLVLPSPVPTSLRVSALSTNMGWPPGAIVLNADDYARAWGSDSVSSLNASLAPGVSPAAGRRALRAALGPTSGLVVKTARNREDGLDAGSRQGLSRLTQIAAMVLISAMIAMAAAMAGMVWQRRVFLAAMKVEGYSTAELWRSLLLEAAVLMGAGCAIGAAFGLLGQGLLSRALTSVTGFPVIYSPAVVNALLSCVAVTLVAVAIVAFFGQRAARVAADSGLH